MAERTPMRVHTDAGLVTRYAVSKEFLDAALRVVVNAYGTKPRHTRAREGGCHDDCIPCGIATLASHFPESGIAARVAQQLQRPGEGERG